MPVTANRLGELNYLRARYYDPSSGQFISRDPAVESTREPYAYVNDNPLNGTDPTGLFLFGGGFGGSFDLNWFGRPLGAHLNVAFIECAPVAGLFLPMPPLDVGV